MMTPEDIKRLNYIRYSSFRPFVKEPHSLVLCHILFLIKSIRYILFYKRNKQELNDVLFLAATVNNKKTIKTIVESLNVTSFTIWGLSKYDLPKGQIYWKSIINLPLFYSFYKSSSFEDKKLIRCYYESFMATCGYCEVYNDILSKNPHVKMIVFTNDHSIGSRSMLEAAEKHHIKTLYVQHASITERFPPLHFSYSFLDGMESYEKYKTIGDVRGNIFLTGSPRFDELYSFKDAIKIYDIGIALNLFDSCDKVIALCLYLQNNISTRIIVRPHPRMGNLFDIQRFRNIGVAISDSTKESSFSFLSKVHFLIANESSIHLDSALIEVPSLLFNFSDRNVIDWYSYIKHGLIRECKCYDDIVKELKKNLVINRENIQYYNASFQTAIEGKVGQFIAGFITTFHTDSETEAFNYVYKVMNKENGCFMIKTDIC